MSWRLAGLLLVAWGLSGCVHQVVVAPPPSFASPVVRPPVTALPPVPKAPELPLAGETPQVVSGRVVIDPGHGGTDPGSQISGVDEKTINLKVAKLIAQKLSQRGVTVVMTRKTDVFIELADRAAAGAKGDLFVSIHADSNPSPEKIGHTILLPQSGDPRATLAGRYIDRQMTSHGSPPHMVRMDTRGLAVLKRAECPAILVELGFLSNPTEAPRLASAAYQEQLAEGVANGILDYLAGRK